MKEFKVPFAYDDSGNIVDRKTAQKGVIYKCNCGADLKLRGGEIIDDHFYHLQETKCNAESFVHKAYKEVFLKTKKIRLPYTIRGNDVLEFDEVVLEKQFHDIRPDAIGYIRGVPYFIEFAKSSYITEAKEDKIKKANVFCIELSISKNVKELKDIEDHLLNQIYLKNIIHNPSAFEIEVLKQKIKKLDKDLYNTNLDLDFYKAKCQTLNKEIIDLKNNYGQITENCISEFFLRYKSPCKNGALYYEKKIGWNSKIAAFVKGENITVKFENVKVYSNDI